MSDWDTSTSWRDYPPTEPQLETIRAWIELKGWPDELPTTRGEASDLIEELIEIARGEGYPHHLL